MGGRAEHGLPFHVERPAHDNDEVPDAQCATGFITDQTSIRSQKEISVHSWVL